LEHFAEGDVDGALWDLRMSLHNFPRFLPAIKLREEILQKREWEDDGTVTREFISRLIMKDTGLGTVRPRFGRPEPVPAPAMPEQTRGPTGFEENLASQEPG
jgi:hypothetical protein